MELEYLLSHMTSEGNSTIGMTVQVHIGGGGICPPLCLSRPPPPPPLLVHQALCQLMHRSLRTVGFQARPPYFLEPQFCSPLKHFLNTALQCCHINQCRGIRAAMCYCRSNLSWYTCGVMSVICLTFLSWNWKSYLDGKPLAWGCY